MDIERAADIQADASQLACLSEDHGIDSVTLARLLAEVRNDDSRSPTAYNRMHNRHNRS